MDGSPRNQQQLQRSERRRTASQPYARPSPGPKRASAVAPATPSRLGSFFSYFSPFRSSAKPAPAPADEDESESGEDEPDDDDTATIEEGTSGDQYATYKQETFEPLDHQAPPSPTPMTSTPQKALPSSKSMPSFAGFSAPRVVPGAFGVPPSPSTFSAADTAASTRNNATEELARFFREKQERGNEPLTAVEQAGVMHLLQQSGQAAPQPFSPAFQSPAFFSPGPASTSNGRPSRGLVPSTSMNSFFAPPSPNAASVSSAGTSSTPFRRRRPIYVGAGYSSAQTTARRRAAASSSASAPQSSTSSPAGDNGKRRRMEQPADDVMDEDAPPTLSLSAEAPPVSTAPIVAPKPKAVAAVKAAASSAVRTPVKPSPLRQVSKADTPSPSPPKKSTSDSAVEPAKSGTPTRASSLMMDIIRQAEAEKPKVAGDAIMNPYEKEDTPLARIPRSRPQRSNTPRKSTAKAKEKAPEKEVSQLELLERSMPPEYRKDDGKRAKVSANTVSAPSISVSPAPVSKTASPAPTSSGRVTRSRSVSPSFDSSASAPKKQMAKGGPGSARAAKSNLKNIKAPPKKQVEVIELSDSSDEDAEDVDELQDEQEDDEEEEEYLPPSLPIFKTNRPSAPVPSPAKVNSSKVSAASPPPAMVVPEIQIRESSPVPVKTKTPTPAAPSIPTFSFTAPPPVSSAPSAFTFSKPSFPTFASTTLPSFSHSAAQPLPSPTSTTFGYSTDPPPKTDKEARKAALKVSPGMLPVFAFHRLVGPAGDKEEDVEIRGAKALAREMPKSELPTFVL